MTDVVTIARRVRPFGALVDDPGAGADLDERACGSEVYVMLPGGRGHTPPFVCTRVHDAAEDDPAVDRLHVAHDTQDQPVAVWHDRSPVLHLSTPNCPALLYTDDVPDPKES